MESKFVGKVITNLKFYTQPNYKNIQIHSTKRHFNSEKKLFLDMQGLKKFTFHKHFLGKPLKDILVLSKS